MAISASEAERGKVYRPTKGAWKGAYYMVPAFDVPKLVKRLRRKANRLNGRESFLLTMAVTHPEWPVFVWYYRGTDPLTKDRFEISRTVLLPPDTRLREVQSKPGFK
jgi:hypothetical protein